MINFKSRFLRFLLFGPIAGAFVETSAMCGALIIWVAFGEPDFYFRGWHSMPLSFFLGCIVGGLAGILYGFLLALFEFITCRTVRLLWFLVNLVLVSFVASILIAYIEIKAFVEVGRLSQISGWWPELFALVIYCIFGPLLSKRARPNQPIQKTRMAGCS